MSRGTAPVARRIDALPQRLLTCAEPKYPAGGRMAAGVPCNPFATADNV
jgi:hypothetical protein